tara:strand:+ start:7497 stop:8681 length:1185 start_codon:yes stop_codon:yes gene_type:complete
MQLNNQNDNKILSNIRPSDKSELKHTIKELYRSKSPMSFIGGGSKINFGNDFTKDITLINTTKLNNIIDYNPSDLVVTVESGTQISKLTDTLKTNNQFLGFRLPFYESSTIGGSLAYGYSGTYRFNDIHLRDSVIGLEFLNHSGDYVQSGGRVVKNVSGYDVHKLFIGTYGAFGPIYSISFKVYPIPKTRKKVELLFDSMNEAMMFGKQFVLYNWNVPRLYIKTSDSTKKYKLGLDIVGTNSVVNKIINSINHDYQKNMLSSYEILSDKYIDDFGYSLNKNEILVKINSYKNDFFTPIASYLETQKIKYDFMINPIFGFALLVIQDNSDLNDYFNNLQLYIIKNNMSMQIEWNNSFQHNFNLSGTRTDNINKILTKSFKNTYDKNNLFSPGKLL